VKILFVVEGESGFCRTRKSIDRYPFMGTILPYGILCRFSSMLPSDQDGGKFFPFYGGSVCMQVLTLVGIVFAAFRVLGLLAGA